MFDKIEDYKKANVLAHTIDVIEGGAKYTNDKADNGGATRYGIIEVTAKEYQSIWKNYNWDGNMRTLPRNLALYICEDKFWKRLNLDRVEKLCPITSAVMFDIAYNVGHSRLATWAQEIINAHNNVGTLYPNIDTDGSFGNTSVSMLEKFVSIRGLEGIKNFTYALTCFQTTHYYNLAKAKESQEKWLYGWSERAGNSLEQYLPLFLKMK